MLMHIGADLVEVLEDQIEVAAAVIPGVQAEFAGESKLAGITGFEQSPPQSRRNHQTGLRAPIVGEVDAVESVTRGQTHQVALEVDDPVHQRRKALRVEKKILHGILEAAQQGIDREPAQVKAGQAVAVAARVQEGRHGGHSFLLAQSGHLDRFGRRQFAIEWRYGMAHRAIAERFQTVAPFVFRPVPDVDRAVAGCPQGQVIQHHVALGLVAAPEYNGDASR